MPEWRAGARLVARSPDEAQRNPGSARNQTRISLNRIIFATHGERLCASGRIANGLLALEDWRLFVYTPRISFFDVTKGATVMRTAKVFMSGNSQAVRLPKEFKINVSEVDIFRQGDDIVLRPAKKSVADVVALLGQLPVDFMSDGRDLSPPIERASF